MSDQLQSLVQCANAMLRTSEIGLKGDKLRASIVDGKLSILHRDRSLGRKLQYAHLGKEIPFSFDTESFARDAVAEFLLFRRKDYV